MRRAGLIPTVLLVVVGCGTDPSSRPTTDRAVAERLARFTIPDSANGLVCVTDSGMSRWLPAPDYAVWGRFDIPRTDLPQVLAGMPNDCTPEPFHDLSRFSVDRVAESWWQPRLLRNPREACWAVPGFSFNLLFGETEREGVLTVYFFNNSN